jgi:hypothetical protein
MSCPSVFEVVGALAMSPPNSLLRLGLDTHNSTHRNLQITMEDLSYLHSLPVELLEQVLEHALTNPKELVARLVCHGFRNASWRALARCIDAHTRFDMRSHQSMMNLKAIRDHEELAKRIAGLTLASYHIPDVSKILRQQNIPAVSIQRAVETQAADDEWDATNARQYVSQENHRADGSHTIDHIISFLTGCLRGFPNLTRVALQGMDLKHYDSESRTRWLPKRYAPIFADLDADDLERVVDHLYRRSPYDEERTLALNRVLHALHDAGIAPKELAIPVEKLLYDEFQVHTSRAVFSKIIKQTETLKVSTKRRFRRKTFCVGDQDAYIFSEENLPVLNHLIFDLGVPPTRTGRFWHNPWCPPWLTRLTVRATWIFSAGPKPEPGSTISTGPSVWNLIFAVSGILRHLTLINVVEGPWTPLLDEFQPKHLETLELQVEDQLFDTRHAAYELAIPPKDLLYGAAENVYLSNEYLAMCESFWAAPTSADGTSSCFIGQRAFEGEGVRYVPTWRKGRGQ